MSFDAYYHKRTLKNWSSGGGEGGSYFTTASEKEHSSYPVIILDSRRYEQNNIYSDYVQQIEKIRNQPKIKEIDYDEQDIKQKVVSTIALIALIILLLL